jgi:hypothetical protein
MALTTAATPVLNSNLMHEKASPINGIGLNKIKPTVPKDQVRIVRPGEYREAAACLAEAFRDDHVVRYPGWFETLTTPH